MTAPAGAVTAEDGSRRYVIKGISCPSANTVLNVLHKEGLQVWKEWQRAKAFAERPHLLDMVRQGDVKQACREANRGWDDHASVLGSAVHLATEEWDRGATREQAIEAVRQSDYWRVVDEVPPFLERWIEARDDYGLVPHIIERTVFHEEYHYAGTMDRAMGCQYPDVADRIHEGCRKAHVLDVKTGARVYPDTALQLTGYAHATHLWDPEADEIEPLEHVCPDVGIIASLHADECKLYPVRLDGAWSAFAASCVVWAWDAEKHDALGKPLTPPSALPW